jgi:hypothetical protein
MQQKQSNIVSFKTMGYTPSEATQLSDGGFIALPLTSLPVPMIPANILGGIPINEVNIANPARRIISPADKQKPGFVIDKHYQTIYIAPTPMEDIAWYGIKHPLFRDHFESFRNGLRIVDTLRTKHYAIPIYEAENIEELNSLAARLPEFNGRRMWFRGQTTSYLLKRTPLVARALFGREDVHEPSLLGAAPRRGWDYNEIHSPLQVLIQDYMYQQAEKRGHDLDKTHQNWASKAKQALPEWDRTVMAMAQHYGIPTNGLDVTSSLEVAIWFATNQYSINSSEQAYFSSMQSADWPSDPKQWPIVFFILPVTESLTSSIAPIESFQDFGIPVLRPTRQKAAFFMGAHGLHQNRLGEALVCGVRLRPGMWETRLSFTYLFPPPEEDAAYAFMFEVRNRHKDGPLGKFFREIVIYAY